jgi:phospholipase/carboxylesterase
MSAVTTLFNASFSGAIFVPLPLDGPTQPPAAGGEPDSLVILLHGYGSNGDDLIGLAPYWAEFLPRTLFWSPHAPEPVPGYPGGRQWFPITAMDPHRLAQGARAAHGVLDEAITQAMARHGVTPARTALVGFSQGTMMALHAGLRRAAPLAGVLGYSGALVAPETLPAEMTAKPPILLVHGDQDDMVPIEAMFAALEGLSAAGHGAQFHVSPGLGHSIGPDGLAAGGAFLKGVLSR